MCSYRIYIFEMYFTSDVFFKSFNRLRLTRIEVNMPLVSHGFCFNFASFLLRYFKGACLFTSDWNVLWKILYARFEFLAFNTSRVRLGSHNS